ncbi:hypothetical protein I3842_05G119800 [Carya illinoinensis]|uniref:Uncharacterized protein n=1 Tax=Carya illinoinensis TaxID=32201 RepID=A0A922F256_CARIL|nr:hypothetical protein I3842_05G119800 [Carya illinoinensis]
MIEAHVDVKTTDNYSLSMFYLNLLSEEDIALERLADETMMEVAIELLGVLCPYNLIKCTSSPSSMLAVGKHLLLEHPIVKICGYLSSEVSPIKGDNFQCNVSWRGGKNTRRA